MNAQEQAKLDEQYRKEAREQQKKRIEAADAADEKVKDAFLACVNAAKECGDTYKKCREAFEAKEEWRKQLIDSLVEREQRPRSSRSLRRRRTSRRLSRIARTFASRRAATETCAPSATSSLCSGRLQRGVPSARRVGVRE